MTRATPVVLLLALAAVLAVAGCGGSGRGASKVSDAQLALMPVPQRDLPGSRGLTVSPDDSGPIDNSRATEGTINPDDTPSDLVALGRLTGYDLSYVDPKLLAFRTGRGLIEIDTSVTLFRGPRAALAFDRKQTEDFTRLARRAIDSGVELVSSSAFRVDRIGDGAAGLRAQFRLGARSVYSTFVDFRVGPLLCEASVTRADRDSAERDVQRIARLLERRVHAVLAGKVRGRPVKVPLPREPAPPPGSPNLTDRVLQLGDLPAGSRIRRDAYVRSPNVVGAFRREFHVGAGLVGGGRVFALQSGVDIFKTPAAALRALASVANVYGGPNGVQLLGELFAGASSGGPLTDGRIINAARIPAGEFAFAVQAEFSVGTTHLEGVLVVVRVGNALGSIIATGEGGRVTGQDLVPLAKTLARRLKGSSLKI